MASLTNKTIASTYKDLLQVSNNNSGVDNTLRNISDGEGTSSAIQISQSGVNIDGDFFIGGEELTATVSALNNIADLTGATGIVAVSGGNVYGRSIAATGPLSVTNANGTEGNPTIALVSSAVSAGAYGPMSTFTVDGFGIISDVTVASTISANAFIGGTFDGSQLDIENNVSVGGNLTVSGITNLKEISATDVVFNTVSATSKIFSPIVSTTGLHAVSASIGDLRADNLSFTSVSAAFFTAGNLTVINAATLAGVSIATVNEVAVVSALVSTNIQAITSINTYITGVSAVFASSIANTNNALTALSATMATSIDNSNTNITANANAITSVNSVITALSATMATSIDNSNTNITANANAITSVNNVITNLSSTMATSIDNTNTNLTALSATMATSIANTNANVTTNINAITSVNSVIANLSATMATSINNTNTNLTALSATMATSIANHLPLSGGTLTGSLTLAGAPSANLEAATKQYVDNLTSSAIHFHDAVRVESISNLNATYDNGTAGVGATLTNAGSQGRLNIDSVALSTNDRVLVDNQTDQTENGVYVVTVQGNGSTNWVLTRATDADSYSPGSNDGLDEGSYFLVTEGNTSEGNAYICSNIGTITFGTTNITFSQFSSSLVYSGGTGINITDSRVISVSGVPSSATIAALSATLATSIDNTNTNLTALSATMATSIDNTNTNLTALSATMATSIDNSNTNITALSATMATSIGNTNTNLTALSATMATSIANHLPLAGGTLTGHVSGTSLTMSGDVSASAYYGDGSNLTGISTGGATEGFAIAIAIALG